MITARQDAFLLALSVASLAFGGLIYVVFRSPSHLYFFDYLNLPWQSLDIPYWAFWLDSIPTFCHALSFSLFTVVTLQKYSSSILLSCLFWAFINSAFEAGQLLKICPTNIFNADFAISHAICVYFRNGTFDPLDILFAWMGAIAAYCIAKIFYFKRPHRKRALA